MTPFRPLSLFEILADHDVAYVTIGGMAATLWGSPLTTGDVDICPAADRDNLARLAGALRALDARVFTISEPDGLPFACDAETLRGARVRNLITTAGRLDLSFRPAGTQGYPDLARDAVTIEIGTTPIRVASLADVIRSKEAAGRERDRQALPTLRRLQEIVDAQDRPGTTSPSARPS